jgi:hypothetical protein
LVGGFRDEALDPLSVLMSSVSSEDEEHYLVPITDLISCPAREEVPWSMGPGVT